MDAAISAKTVHRRVTSPPFLAVASGKGGVGKTWLSISLAQALARLGQKVLLFDGDLGLANVDIQLGLDPRYDLGGVLAGRYSLAEAVFDCESAGISIIAGHSGSGTLANMADAKLHALVTELSTLSDQYHTVVIDLGAGVQRAVMTLAAQARTCLVVTTDEPTSLTDAYAFLKLNHRQQAPVPQVVVNMASSNAEGERTYCTLLKACESFLKIRPALAGVVRRDSKVREAIRNQSPLLTRHPNSTAAEDIARIARAVQFSPDARHDRT